MRKIQSSVWVPGLVQVVALKCLGLFGAPYQ